MEAFTLLKYWKTGAAPTPTPTPSSAPAEDTSAILAAVPQNDNIETTTDDDDDSNDEGPFIDLEFAVPDEEEANDDSESDEDAHENPNEDDNENNNNDESESEREFKFTLSPSTNEPSDDPSNLPEDLFFKGKLVLNDNSSQPNSKPPPQLFTASLLKSATKFRVFMSGLKKPKSSVSSSDKDSNASDSVPQNPKQQEPEPKQRKLFTVKLKVEEVPIVSLFTRDNSSKGGTTNKPSQKQQKHQNTQEAQTLSYSEEKQRFSKEVMQKYLKMVKPLYIKVSRRYAEKLRLSGQLSMPPPPPPEKPAPAKVAAEKVQSEAEACDRGGNNLKGQKQGNLHMPAGLRVVCKHLGKSRSASSSAPAPSPAAATVSSRRRDDSLLQQHDGIQSAILHCKKSFNASRECESSQLMPRSVSNPFKEISPELSSRKSKNEVEEKRL